MKNLINYYYNLTIKNFKKSDEKIIFKIDGQEYEFIPFYSDINKLYEIYHMLIKNKKYCHELIFNKDKNLITVYDNKPHILIRKNIKIEKKVDMKEIVSYDVLAYDKTPLNWKNLWENKIDYYEYQISQLSPKYSFLKKSFDYYIGLSENAISLLNYIDFKNIQYYISHKRIKYNESLDYFFNPVNIVVDSRVRDIAEYYKNIFFESTDEIDINDVFVYYDVLGFSYSESILFLARLLYPSHYFDIYDEIIQGKKREDKLEKYIKKNISYEIFVKQIYKHIKTKYKIPLIEWLES